MIDTISQNHVLKSQFRGLDCTLYESVEPIRHIWESLDTLDDLFLSPAYLMALEEAPPRDMSFFYVLLHRDEQLVGIIYFQLNHFNAGSSLNYDRNGEEGKRGKRFVKAIREFVAHRIDFHTLICGNSTISGEHAYRFAEAIGEEDQLRIVDEVAQWVKAYARGLGYNVQLLFIKDYFKKTFSSRRSCAYFPEYNEFSAQPGMEMSIDREWSNFDNYMAALSSKYRVRVRRARKKLNGVVFAELNLDEVRQYETQIYRFYRAIADKAAFNLFILGEYYFSALKKHLREGFRLFGCYLDGKLVAFYSIIENGTQLEAHFLGYEETMNREYQLYLNMLLDIVDHAITGQFESIFFARTAIEIKSSVGAVPRDMYFYLQHSKGLQNKLLPHIYNILDPREEYVLRSPLKS